MQEWEQREAELRWKEGAYERSLTTFQKLIDNPVTFVLLYTMLMPTGFVIGIGIGMLL